MCVCQICLASPERKPTTLGQCRVVCCDTDGEECDILRTTGFSTNKNMGKAHIRVFQLFVKQPHCYCFPVNMNYYGVSLLYNCPFLCERNPRTSLDFPKGVIIWFSKKSMFVQFQPFLCNANLYATLQYYGNAYSIVVISNLT